MPETLMINVKFNYDYIFGDKHWKPFLKISELLKHLLKEKSVTLPTQPLHSPNKRKKRIYLNEKLHITI